MSHQETGNEVGVENEEEKGKSEIDKEKDIKDLPTSASDAFDLLLASVGNGGRWQVRHTLIPTGYWYCVCAFHFLGGVFLGATPEFKCDNPYLRNVPQDSPLYETTLNFTTPWVRDNEGKEDLSKCFYFDRSTDSNQNPLIFKPFNSSIHAGSAQDVYNVDFNVTIPPSDEWSLNPDQLPCMSWIYDTSVFESTVVTEWNLVCDRTYLKSTLQSTFMMGVLVGALTASGLSDRFGRRPTLLGAAFLMSISALVVMFSTSLEMFLFFRALLGASAHGAGIVSWVILVESSGRNRRELYGNVASFGWQFGCLVVFVPAYYLRDWRNLQLGITVPTFVCIALYWLVPESPRWLMTKGRFEDGLALLEQIGKGNGGKKLPPKATLDHCLNVIKEDLLMRKKNAVSCSASWKQFFRNVYSLVKTPIMRRRSLIMFYCWFVVSMNYYGIIFSGENIGVSLHIMMLIGSTFTAFVPLICYYSALWFGRRKTLSFSSLLAGAVLISIIFVPTSLGWVNMLIAMFGRLCLGVVFTTVYFYSAEVVPTNIRNIAIGMASSCARVGSTIGPYIVDLGGSVYYALPSTVFGILSLISGILALWMPETSQRGLVETIQEIELMHR